MGTIVSGGEWGTGWSEAYIGGSPEAEAQYHARLAEVWLRTGAPGCRDGLPFADVVAEWEARITFRGDLPLPLRVGFVQPAAGYPAHLRLSRDGAALGLAVRIRVSEDETHDFLLADAPATRARDAAAWTQAHRRASDPQRRARDTSVLPKIAGRTFWSQTPIRWGQAAVVYLFRPLSGTVLPDGEPDTLRLELCLQPFIDESLTPIEDATRAWDESASSPLPVADLVLAPGGASISSPTEATAAFNPWNTTETFRPLGRLNRARKLAYDLAQARARGGVRPAPPQPMRNRIVGTFLADAFRILNRHHPWHRLPAPLNLLNLDALRRDLRRWNLLDPAPADIPPEPRPVPLIPPEEVRRARTADGRWNDLARAGMGAAGAPFGRNMPLCADNSRAPDPITVARALLDRRAFRPAAGLNVLTASWIQFQVHDWVAHARHPLGPHDVNLPLPPDRPPWRNTVGGPHEPQMRLAGNIPVDPARDWLHANAVSHWWDASAVYGSDAANAARLRDGPRLRLDGGYLPTDIAGHEVTGFSESWWLGLSVLHTLFAREHNLLCDELRRAYPRWNDEQTYGTARLIVSALIARIHTLDWTPALLGGGDMETAMRLNWSGPRPGDWSTRLAAWAADTRAFSGMAGAPTDHHGVPFALTEEFVTVYRMHQLIPDDYVFCDSATGAERERHDFPAIQGDRADEVMRRLGLRDAIYSLGVAPPGAITLHNFPLSLTRFERDGEVVDLAVADVVRTRMRRVPRYAAFRRHLRMPPLRGWNDVTDDPEDRRLLREIYGSTESVDTVVGLVAETPPHGFAFSDTAFRIFLLMASRRLESDRFLTADFRPEVYTPLGIDWIENNDMASVVRRHCPELASVLPDGRSAFTPWRIASDPE